MNYMMMMKRTRLHYHLQNTPSKKKRRWSPNGSTPRSQAPEGTSGADQRENPHGPQHPGKKGKEPYTPPHSPTKRRWEQWGKARPSTEDPWTTSRADLLEQKKQTP